MKYIAYRNKDSFLLNVLWVWNTMMFIIIMFIPLECFPLKLILKTFVVLILVELLIFILWKLNCTYINKVKD